VKKIPLNKNYTFANFVVGPSNRLCHAAAVAVAESPGSAFNPLFMHGSVGLGKTHLLQAVCHAVLEREPGTNILYLSCETFTNHFISAVEKGNLEEFRNRYRHVDLLLIDDIQLLADKERTQEEFFHTFNTLYNSGKQIVLSSDSPPKDIPTLRERLVSRFRWGLVASLEPPSVETRMAIVRRKAALHDADFPNDVVEYIAQEIKTNIREIEGAVNKLIATAMVRGEEIDRPMAMDALKDIIGPGTRPAVTMDDIIKLITKTYRVRLSDLQSKKRSKSVSLPRQICMYLARKLTNHSLEEIGGYFGGRDHTTVMYAEERISAMAESNPEFRRSLETFDRELGRLRP
jgi:chromosomal replication initiator protein